MKELRWVVLLPTLTLLLIEGGLRCDQVRRLALGEHDLPFLIGTPEAVNADPAEAWLRSKSAVDLAARVALWRNLDQATRPSDRRSVFVLGDSTCQYGFQTSDLATALGDGTAAHKLCVVRAGFGGAERIAEIVAQIPRQQQRGTIVWVQLTVTGGYADTPREMLGKEMGEDPDVDLSLRFRLFGPGMLSGVPRLPWWIFTSKTAIGRYNGALPYRLLMWLLGSPPSDSRFIMPDDPAVARVSEPPIPFDADESIHAMYGFWSSGMMVTYGLDVRTADQATYRALRTIATMASERNLDLVLLSLPSPQSDKLRHRMIELHGESGRAWVKELEHREQALERQVQRECAELRVRRVRASSIQPEDYIAAGHVGELGEKKLVQAMRDAIFGTR